MTALIIAILGVLAPILLEILRDEISAPTIVTDAVPNASRHARLLERVQRAKSGGGQSENN